MCAILQKIEVDPVKFAAELESYEDLKRRLVVDAALFGAVGAFATFQVRLSFFVDGIDLSHTNLESFCSSSNVPRPHHSVSVGGLWVRWRTVDDTSVYLLR